MKKSISSGSTGSDLILYLYLSLIHISAVGLAHTHHSLVDIDIRVVDSSELELVHQVIVHFLAVDACVQPGDVYKRQNMY